MIFKISQNLYEENKKKSKVFPIFVKMKNIGAYNEFVQIMVTNYWIFFWYFIFIHYTNYLENESYHMDVVTLTCIVSSHNHYLILCISNCKKIKIGLIFMQCYFQYISIHIQKNKNNLMNKKLFKIVFYVM